MTRNTTEDIEDAILSKAADSRQLRAECDAFLPRIADVWAELSPERTVTFKHSIRTERRPAPLTEAGLRRGEPIGRVYNDDPIAPFIEYGTGDPLGHYSRASQCCAPHN